MAKATLEDAIKAARAAGLQRGGAYQDGFLRKVGITDEYKYLLLEAKLIRTISPEGYTAEQIESLAPTQAEAIAKYLELRKDKQLLKATFGEPLSQSGTFDAGAVVISTPSGSNQMPFGDLIANPNAATLASGLGWGSGNGTVASDSGMSQAQSDRKSAYDLLYSQFKLYGLEKLVEPLKNLITENISPSEFTLRLRESDAYKKRFAANTQRIQKGLRALSEAEYITLEDQYQNVMRNYGLPASYYTRGDMGVQQGFEKFIAGDVSAAELEDRIQTAQNRVLNAAPEVANTLRQFYPDIKDGDILAYALDPDQALTNIKRKVQAAEIGAGAAMAGLSTGLARAEELQRYGVTGEQARQGYQAIGGLLPRATQLGEIYAKSGMGPYTQTTAEAEVFATPGAIEAERKRKQLAQLEQAAFSGKTGAAGGALGRERAGQF